MHIFEDILAKFGSRMGINFIPRKRCVHFSGLGMGYNKPLDLLLGVRIGRERRALPFTKLSPVFESVEQEITPNTITFRCRSLKIKTVAEFKFIAPFYPQDAKLSTAPFFYIDVKISKCIPSHYDRDYSPLKGEILFLFPKIELWKDKNGLLWEELCTMVKDFYLPYPYERKIKLAQEYNERSEPIAEKAGYNFSIKAKIPAGYLITPENSKAIVSEHGYAIPFKIERGEYFQTYFVWSGFIKDKVMEVREKPYRFKYLDYFKDIKEVKDYAIKDRERIMEKSEFFDSLFTGSSLGKTKLDLMAYTIHSYIQNTWWAKSVKGNEDWFSVWEGSCFMHSTLDVEYNCSPFLLMFWPELMEKILDQHVHYKKDGFMSHDMGAFLQANEPYYPHEMEIEENCNFILLNYALWKFTGKFNHIRKHYSVIKELLQFNMDSDTTGDGIPNKGTANTIDDASPAVQYSKKQVYLAVKALGSYIAGEEIAKGLGDVKIDSSCRRYIRLISKTVDNAWLGDHFPVCLDKSTKGLVDSWTRKPIGGKYLKGWDAYTLYISNGLLFPLMAGARTHVDLDKFRIDLINSIKHSLVEYGCTHSSSDKSNLWISQNIWRDIIGGYLGVDNFEMADRYWAFEVFENTSGRGGCFIDTHGNNWLAYYPRGVAILGYFYAMAGIRIDKGKKIFSLHPVSTPLRIPLFTSADWKRKGIPWLTINTNIKNLEK